MQTDLTVVHEAIPPPEEQAVVSAIDTASSFSVSVTLRTMRVDIIGHLKSCMTEIYLHIDARMADYIHTHP